ncbi:MAG: transporter [Proteobacteria bacterium]|nr:transporter [Pseudomonadota bacterium]
MKKFCLTLLLVLCLFKIGHSAHPLITDDTGTQGKGKFQLELNSEYSVDSQDGIKEKVFEFAPILSYGVFDNLDVIISVPYQSIKTEDNTTLTESKESGVSDLSLELKWRFFEADGLSFALKPGVSFPTGDENKGLGSGKTDYSLFLITTKEIKPVNLHLNLGYIRNENKFQERKDIFHLSLAGEYEATEKLKLVANMGTETNADPASKTDPAFVLIGFIYSFSDKFSFDAGYKYGLNKPETDNTYLLGITFKF